MATRTVSTKLAIQGEEQYKSSIKTINSTLATLKSELKPCRNWLRRLKVTTRWNESRLQSPS